MGRVVGNIYRVLESALREQMDGFIKCPACNGSGMTSNATDLLSKNCHSLNGRPCWFCEGHGVLPLTGLRGFVVVRTASYSQTHNWPPTRTDGFSSIVSFSKSCIHKIHDCTSIKFRPCLGAKWYLFSISEHPSWLADARHGVVQQAVYANETESQEEVLFGHHKLFRAFHSAVLLISLLASASSSQAADALVSSYNHSPGAERIENADNGFNQSDAVFQFAINLQTQPVATSRPKISDWGVHNLIIHGPFLDSEKVCSNGKELGSCRKPCRRTQKRRNRLREKALEEAEVRARSILMGLVPRGPESYH
ncbi:uncharacterized protein LOC131227370 isoform X2 [Magnolia sinica]|uniref:uncharacterized protein LOC131227370 isoform X2 n=1 Tax=Magnolia sinica TaxID=86752 RepID=UPI00265896A9|nr:uncharacterized protein LOC131227370 isoform X2 [Magnolia sinica]